MRNPSFLVSFLMLGIGVCVAGETPAPLQPKTSATRETPGSDDGIYLTVPNPDLTKSADASSKDDNVCLMLRTYTVSRSERVADDSRVVRYTVCQPARKYNLRSTAPVELPESR